MKKKHLHTRFINFLIEQQHSNQEDIESQNLHETDDTEEENLESDESEDVSSENDDEIIEKLLTEYRNVKRKYENIRNR
jgi:hypothetical protein